MKLRTMAVVVLGVGAIVGGGAGCKKKKKEGIAPDMSGSASGGTMTGSGTGAAMTGGSAEAPKEAKLEGKALADKYLECTSFINSTKWDDFKSKCLAKDYKGHEADGPDTNGADAVIEWFKGQATAFPDMKIQPQLVLVNGRNTLAVALVTGTNSGPMKTPMGEAPATNKKLGELMFHRLAWSDDNRVTEEWSYFDPSTMMSQLGMMPKEAPKMRDAVDKGWEGAPIVVVAADDAKEKANLEAVQKVNAAYAAKKPADYMAIYADDAFESDQASAQDTKGKKAIQAGSEMFLKAFPDLKMETPDNFAVGDYVVTLGSFSGTNTGAMGPMKATKKPVKGQFAEVVKLKDGKLTELWRFRNGMAMAMQLGLMPEPKGAPAGGGSGSAAAPAGGSADMKGGDMKGHDMKGGDMKGSAAAPAGSAK